MGKKLRVDIARGLRAYDFFAEYEDIDPLMAITLTYNTYKEKHKKKHLLTYKNFDQLIIKIRAI